MVSQPLSAAESVQQESIKLPRTSESEELKKIRHTTSHVMAIAGQKLFPMTREDEQFTSLRIEGNA